MKLPKKSKIEWTHYTGGPWLGCSEVSPGCLHCYARTLMLLWFASIVRKAYKAAGFPDWKTRPVWGNKAPRVITKGFAAKARSLNAKAAKEGIRYRMFPSIDWLDDMPAGIIDQEGIQWEPLAVFAEFLNVIRQTPNLDYLLLTKRPENCLPKLREIQAKYYSDQPLWEFVSNWLLGEPPQNVWIGASAEDQPRADERIPELLKIPARIRFLSVEPMLGPIDFPTAAPCGYYCDHDEDGGGHRPGHGLSGIHWVIFGGESGPGARPCNIEWIRDGVNQCRSAGVAPFVKQLGGNPILTELRELPPKQIGDDGTGHWWKLSYIKDKKGGNISEFPEDLRVREFPTR